MRQMFLALAMVFVLLPARPVAARSLAVEPQALRQLSASAANIARDRKGYIGVAVYRLDTDELYSFQGTRRFEMYSTAKVPIMLAVLDKVVREERRATTREQVLIESMIQHSDNNAATTLIKSVGGAAGVEAFLQRNGITETDMNGEAWGASTTTAQDMARLMARLGTCSLLVQRLCTYALTTMRNVAPGQAWGITAGVPNRRDVALKNGWYPNKNGWGIHSMGLITSGTKRYAIAVYTHPDPSMGYGITTIEQISRAVYGALN